MASLRVAMVVLMCMAVMAAPITQAAISCGQVANSLAPCLTYLTGRGLVTPACCSGLRSLVSAAKTPQEKQTACNCLKSAAGNLPGLVLTNAANLPSKCRVNFPYKISISTNCATSSSEVKMMKLIYQQFSAVGYYNNRRKSME